MAEYQIIKTGGFVNIKDISAPESFAKLDFTGAVGSFYTRLGSDSGGPANGNTLTIVHAVAGEILTGIVDEFVTPSDASLITLRPIIDALLNTPSTLTPATPMEPKNTIYVSAAHGSPTGTGAIDDPINTIADGMLLAETAGLADSLAWELRVLAGTYDEQITQAAGANNVYVTLTAGVNVSFSGLGPTVDDADHSMYINMEQGSNMENTGGGAVLSGATNNTTVIGPGTLTLQSVYPLVECGNAGSEVNLVGCTLLNLAGGVSEIINITDGTIRLTSVAIIQVPNHEPIVKDGGILHMTGTGIYAPTATNYATTSGAESIQVVNCVSNLVAGAGITETVGAMLVDAAYAV